MKIARAASLLQPHTQKKLGEALVAGKTITVAYATEAEASEIKAHFDSPEANAIVQQWRSSQAQSTVLVVEESVFQVLMPSLPIDQFSPEQKLLIGMGTGAMVGSGAALLLQTLGAVAPKSAMALTFGCALIGSGIGGAKAADVLPKIGIDPKGKFTIS